MHPDGEFLKRLNQGGRRLEELKAETLDESEDEDRSWSTGMKLMESPWAEVTPRDVQGYV